MALYNGLSRLSDVIFANPAVITVINRLGVRLGVGDGTISDYCSRHGIDKDFFLAIINTYENDDYFPEDASSMFGMEQTVRYLMQTDAYYLHAQIPNVERHLDMLVSRSGEEDNNLGLLRKFFMELKQEMAASIATDREQLFPALLAGRYEELTPELTARAAHEGVEEKIDDLLSFFVMHLRGRYDENLCVAVVTAIFSLRKDVGQNNRIRERMLLPKLRRHGRKETESNL